MCEGICFEASKILKNSSFRIASSVALKLTLSQSLSRQSKHAHRYFPLGQARSLSSSKLNPRRQHSQHSSTVPSHNRQDGKFFVLTAKSKLQTFPLRSIFCMRTGRQRGSNLTSDSHYNLQHDKTTSQGPMQTLTEWPGLGSIRRHGDTPLEIRSRPRSLPSSFLQEHAGNRTSHQWLEVGARCEVP